MARPTKWSKELEAQAYEYIKDYQVHGHMIPSIEGLAMVLDLHRDTLYDWAKHDDKEFSDILGKILNAQEFWLVQNGLNNTFNSAITKLVLGKHGYHEKMDQDITTKGEAMPTTIELVAKK